MNPENQPSRTRKRCLGHRIGFAGIVSIGLFILLTYISDPPEWVKEWSAILLLIGGEVLVAIGSVATGSTKGRLGLGLLMVLLGPIGFLVMVFASYREATDASV